MTSDLTLQPRQPGPQDARRDAGVQVTLELQQLAQEVEVWRDDGTLALDELVAVRHGHPGDGTKQNFNVNLTQAIISA